MSLAEAVRPTVPAWRAWLHIARVSNTPTVVSNAVAGALLASTAAETGTVALVALAMALFYTAGMVLNDLADGLAILATEDVAPLLAGVGLVVLIVLYDLWHKDNPVSPALMAGCRALVYVIAGVAVASELPGDLWGAVALLFVYVVGLTRVAKVEGGGIIGAWPVVAVLAPSVYWAFQLPSAASFLLLAAFAAWTLWALHLVHARRIGHAVGALIAGIALFDALAV